MCVCLPGLLSWGLEGMLLTGQGTIMPPGMISSGQSLGCWTRACLVFLWQVCLYKLIKNAILCALRVIELEMQVLFVVHAQGKGATLIRENK